MSNPTSTKPTRSPEQMLELIEVKPGLKFSLGVLKDMLPTVQMVMFFAKVYELDAQQLGNLLMSVMRTPLVTALVGEADGHSTELQDYIVEIIDDIPELSIGDVQFSPDVPKGEILPEVWKSMEVEIADSIKAVAKKLENIVGLMPGKQGSMVFQSMLRLNVKRPTLGDHRAKIHHAPKPDNLLVLDVSGSMTEATIQTIVDDVVALSYTANAHLAIVSNTTTHWEPGQYDSASVLQHAQFGGTHYETLKDLLNQDWGVVISVADYDSSPSAKQTLARCTGSIDTLFDVSLVDRPTFLAECLGQHAGEVKPLLIGNSRQVLGSNQYW